MATKQLDIAPLMTDDTGKDRLDSNRFLSGKKSKWSTCSYIKISLIMIIFVIGIYLIIAYFVQVFPFNRQSDSVKPGLYGKWPVHGGNIQQQQRAPNENKIKITKHNIVNLSIECVYNSIDGTAFMGYPTIDENNNAYFCDASSGYITSINLDNNCTENWRSHIGELLGHDKSVTVNNYQTLTIIQDSNGNKGLLFGTPTGEGVGLSTIDDYSCYAVAVHLNNGSLWWKLKIGDGLLNKNDYLCASHGFIVEDHYAYGGIKKGNQYWVDKTSRFIGRYIKIDIDKHEIVNEWYPIKLEKTEFDEYNKSYRGISSYAMSGAIIDDYLIFGTSNLHGIPQYIDDCISYALNNSNTNSTYNPFVLLNESASEDQDICGNNRSNIPQWRCLEKQVYVDSLIILNKNTFEMIKGIPLQGIDVSLGGQCVNTNSPPFYCPENSQILSLNSDLTAVSAYKDNNGNLFTAAASKSGRFYIFEVESGELVITKQFAPQSTGGLFPLAIDEESMIGITVYNGIHSFDTPTKYKLLNNMTVCNNTASIHAFNLSTGQTIWQLINPFGTINENKCFNDSFNWNYDSVSATTCEMGPFLDINEYLTVKNVDILPLPRDPIIPIQSNNRAKFRAPLTIVKDMVFIPSDTGDVWVVDLYDGTYIHDFSCPNDYIDSYSAWNRPGIKSGITVFEDRVVFYCGTYWYNDHQILNGNSFVSMKLS